VLPFPDRFTDADDTASDKTWCYEQSIRGGRRHFTGEVAHAGGDEGQRVRKELAVVLTDLLRWARQQQAQPDVPGGREDDRAA
jgi:hypothetical protein